MYLIASPFNGNVRRNVKLSAASSVIGVALALSCSAPTGAADKSGLGDIVLWHEVRVAFYEKPPRSVVRSMRQALGRACQTPVAARAPWYCNSGEFYLVRGVDVLGNRQLTGFVCPGKGTLRYYPPDLFGEDSECAFIAYSHAKKQHFIDEEL
jgi:hypothetical protein